MSCDFEHSVVEVAQDNMETVSSRSNQRFFPAIRPSLTVHPSGMSEVEGSRVLELRLLHHYTTTTSKQLPESDSPKGEFTWAVRIPQLAFQFDLALSALLGISALHHWALTPSDPKLLYAAKYYFDRAVRDHRKALSVVDEESAEAVLATAILITHHNWLALHSDTSNTPYELNLQTYYMARGIMALFDQMCRNPWPSLQDAEYLWYIERPPSNTNTEEEEPCVDPFLISSQEDLAKLSTTFDDEAVSPEDKIVYEKAVADLLSMCLAICRGASQHQLQRRVATMPLRLPERFLEMAELKDPRALALLARNLALLKVIDSVWWLQGTGSSQKVPDIAVTGIWNTISKDWAWAMEWPLKVVSGDLKPAYLMMGQSRDRSNEGVFFFQEEQG